MTFLCDLLTLLLSASAFTFTQNTPIYKRARSPPPNTLRTLLSSLGMPSKGEQAMKELVEELLALGSTYHVQKFLSSGSYGAVCAGTDAANNPVAIKRVFNTVSDGRTVNILSDSFLAKRVLREVRLLNHFHHPNILGLMDLILDLVPPNKHKLYLVTELMRTDLAQVISDARIEISKDHIQYFMYNILLGLHALHAAGVVHRDLHPGNVLLDENNDIKICDFNLAREDTADNEKTHYVTHRWYRAPELVMQFKGFTKKVDMWSAGCVMGELFNRKALFRGTTFYNQLNKIVETLGTPKDEDVTMFSSASARDYLHAALAKCQPKAWGEIVPNADPVALDLLSKMLCFNPQFRITAEEALQHEYFADLYDPSDLTSVITEPFHFDESVNDVQSMHKMFQDEVVRFQELRARRSRGPASPTGGVTNTTVANGATGKHDGHVPRTTSLMNLELLN